MSDVRFQPKPPVEVNLPIPKEVASIVHRQPEGGINSVNPAGGEVEPAKYSR